MFWTQPVDKTGQVRPPIMLKIGHDIIGENTTVVCVYSVVPYLVIVVIRRMEDVTKGLSGG